MSLIEMRTELKKLRKDIMPTPVSRMKKCDIANQIERLKPNVPEVKKIEAAEEVVEKKTKAAKKEEVVVKKAKAEPKKEEVVVKKAKAEPKKAKAEPKKTKAGSVEMRTKMAALRAKRTAKKSE